VNPPMRSRTTIALLAALLVFGVLARVAYVRHTLVIVDEFEHLHAAYLVSRGETPYVDFFEHHPPVFYAVAGALLPARPSFDTIIHARYVALASQGLAIAIAARWVWLAFGGAEALVAVVMLLGNFFLFARGSLGYLDTHALPLVLLSAWALTRSEGQARWAAVAGACLALATLITQKAAPAALAPLALFAARACPGLGDRVRRRRCLRDATAWVGGALVAALLVPVLLGRYGTAAFLRDAILLNLHWKARRFPLKELGVLAITDGAVYAVALLGLATRARELARRRFAVTDGDLPAFFLAALAAGIVVLPVVWEEYFVLVVPFAVVVASVTLTALWRRHADGAGAPVLVAAGLVVLMAGDLVARVLVPTNPLPVRAAGAAAALWLLLATLALQARGSRATAAPALCLACLLVLPLVEQADWIHHNSNAGQRARVEYVLGTTAPDQPVFDGYSGFGVFRPHAYTYWFLHEEMQAMLSDEDRGASVIRALEETEPPIAIVDDYVTALPPEVLAHIRAHYADTQFPEIKRRLPETGATLAGRHVAP
jgi:hypothetical protein